MKFQAKPKIADKALNSAIAEINITGGRQPNILKKGRNVISCYVISCYDVTLITLLP